MNRKAISLLSGGLDSLLATKAVLDQGVEVIGLHFTSPLCNGIGQDAGERALAAGAELGIRVLVEDKGEAYLDVVRNPRYGYGKNMNPCIDCRIYMLGLTRRIMEREGASFIVTGEVVGQRPMSQMRETINLIERESGLAGLLVRPLSGKLFPPTLPEKEGVIDREGLFSLSGRSRHGQYELTRRYGLAQFASPGGGCLLTDPIYARKLRDFFEHDGAFTMEDIALLRVGRHFRFQGRRLVFGRNKEENDHLEAVCSPRYTMVRPAEFKGPTGVVRGEADEAILRAMAAIAAFYGKSEASPVVLEIDGKSRRGVEPLDADPRQYLIKEST